MTERYEEMGMTDMQFKVLLRELISSLKSLKESKYKNEEIDKIIARLEIALED